jgi:hypothetical protein
VNALFGSLLALVVLVFLGITGLNYQENALEETVQNALVNQIAQEQVQFAQAVNQYITAHGASAGTSITVSELRQQGYLPQGYLQPSGTNPLGQTPVAYVGSNGMALAVYNQGPNTQTMEQVGIGNALSLQNGFALRVAARAAAMEETLPAMVAVTVSGNTAQTPYGGYTNTQLSTEFSGYPSGSISVPSLGVLINALPH